LFEVSFLNNSKSNFDFLKKAAKKLPILCKIILKKN
jgi:hypothetical protein